MRLGLAALLLAASLTSPPKADDFIPKDAANAVASGCMVSGVDEKDGHPYAEVQVFVKWSREGSKGWDFKPVMSRYTAEQGGVFKAFDDCIEWQRKMKATLEKAMASK